MHRILYHMDADGQCAGAIIYKWLREVYEIPDEEIFFHPINYGMDLPEMDPDVDFVYMVDFSLQPLHNMQKLYEDYGDRLIWIDHHDTSVLMSAEAPELKEIKGVRKVELDAGTYPGTQNNTAAEKLGLLDRDLSGHKISGCELTWMFCFGEPIPAAVTLVGDWDTWRHKELDPEEHSTHFQLYLGTIDTRLHKNGPGLKFWMGALDWFNLEWLHTGHSIKAYRDEEYRKAMNLACTGTVSGLKALIVNRTGNSQMFQSEWDPEKYDIMVGFSWHGLDYLTVSLYSTKPDIHCGKLAKQLGEAGDIPSGGGHPGAAGFQCGWEYFRKLIKNPKSLK